jgi:hypothetical protein
MAPSSDIRPLTNTAAGRTAGFARVVCRIDPSPQSIAALPQATPFAGDDAGIVGEPRLIRGGDAEDASERVAHRAPCFVRIAQRAEPAPVL